MSHFTRKHHTAYDDTGRVIGVRAYQRIVHSEDHLTNDGFTRPHRHLPKWLGGIAIPERTKK